MKSLFEMTFQNRFQGDSARGFQPAPRLGQIITDIEQSPLTDWKPDQSTQIPMTRPAGTSDTDWAKILAEGLKAASQGYGAYTQGQIAKMKAEADLLKTRNPSVASLLPSDSKTTTIALVVGGIAVLGLIAVVALK